MTQQRDDGPIVSVILPAYNVERYVNRSIKSVREQSLSDIEILIVDDASSDGTREAIEKLAAADSRIRPIYHKENKGVSAARNSALDLAKGKWVAVVDPDDWIAPTRLETLVTLAEDKDADAVADNQVFVDPDTEEPSGHLITGETRDVWHLTTAEFLANDLPEVIGFGVLKMMIRRSFIEAHNLRYREEVSRGEDCLFYCDCFFRGAQVYLTSTPYYFYRVNREGSATHLTMGMPAIISVAEVHREVEQIFSGTTDAALLRAIALRKQLIDECVQYRNVVTPLKNYQFGKALAEAFRRPSYLAPVTRRMMNAAWARYQKTS